MLVVMLALHSIKARCRKVQLLLSEVEVFTIVYF